MRSALLQKKRVSLLRRWWNSKLLLVVALVILVLLSVVLTKELWRKYEVDKEISALEKEISGLEDQQQEFASLIDYFNTESFQEQEARLKLGLQKPGEKVVIISGTATNQSPTTIATATTTSGDNRESNPAKWWNYFFSIN